MSSTFPTHLVPEGIFRDYIESQEKNSEAHPAYHFGGFVTGASLMLGHKCYFDNGQFRIRPNMYTLIVGRSGFARKSSSVQPIINAIEQVNSNYTLEGNFSSESLIQLFRAQSDRILFLDEVRHLFEQSRKSFAQGILTNITKLFNCPSSLRSEYKSSLDDNGDINEENIALDPYLCILGLTTIDWFEATDKEIMGGFVGRFFPIKVKDNRRKWIPTPTLDKQLELRIVQKFHQLHAMKGRFTWTPEALALWNTYYPELMERASTAINYQAGSFGSRLGDYLIKLSMIFNALTYGKLEIEPDSIEHAKKFVELGFDYHLELLDTVNTTEHSKQTNKILNIIDHCGGQTDRSHLVKYSHMDAADFDKLCVTLVASNRIGVVKFSSNTKPKIIYYNPLTFTVINGELSKLE